MRFSRTSRSVRSLVLFLTLLGLLVDAAGQETETDAPSASSLKDSNVDASSFAWRDWIEKAGVGGHARFDFYTASKRLDGNRNLPGLTFQPRAQPKFGSWGDAKIEGRLTDEDLVDHREPKQARLLEAYANLYFGAVDLRVGKQNIPWGRADALNPTDNRSPDRNHGGEGELLSRVAHLLTDLASVV